MKELTIEQKAAAYDEAIERVEDIKAGKCETKFIFTEGLFEHIFPELKESEDEKIRKRIIKLIKMSNEVGGFALHKWEADEMLAWLENQGEHKPAIEMKTPEESLGIDSDTYNKIVDECIYGEQKPVVTPKFRIGDIITPKGKKEYYTIIDIVDGWYEFKEKHVNGGIPIYYQFGWELVEQKPADKVEPKFGIGDKIIDKSFPKNVFTVTEFINDGIAYVDKNGERFTKYYDEDDWDEYELVEQKPAEWSEEEIRTIFDDYIGCRDTYTSCINRLKSLRPQWKPTKEQMDALLFVVQHYTPKVTDKLACDSIKTLELMYHEIKQ